MGAEQDVLLRLDARTTLSPRDALGVVKDVVGGARVAGVSMDKWTEITIGAGQRIVVDGEDEKGIALSIMNMKIVQFCTFSAEVRAIEDGTWLRVGALESYKIGQDKLLYFIPLGPKKVPGLGLYKRFLQAVAGAVRSADPNASVSVGIGDPSRP